MERVRQLVAHISEPNRLAALERKSPDDVVITMAIRSPLCKARKGGFKDVRSESHVVYLMFSSINDVLWLGPMN